MKISWVVPGRGEPPVAEKIKEDVNGIGWNTIDVSLGKIGVYDVVTEGGDDV